MQYFLFAYLIHVRIAFGLNRFSGSNIKSNWYIPYQISDLLLYVPWIRSGDIKCTVPLLDDLVFVICAFVKNRQTSKSAIFAVPFLFKRILEPMNVFCTNNHNFTMKCLLFMSRWIMPLEWINIKPFNTWLHIRMASISRRRLFSFIRFSTDSCKSIWKLWLCILKNNAQQYCRTYRIP